ncbi:dynamin family protein [Alteribacter aurantiacus]|uniref:dynamin family protein n=1 Tax=Alteribacter aurantiacus TaxID=254410 RepID=UPI000429C07E|nr:dynamin family protein [Alteribacter aurantiacus]
MTIIVKDLTQNKSHIPYTIEEKFRLQKLENKYASPSFEVAFCGHFSAGKSTLLNSLVGAEILPTSPIPTSANIIAIENGELGLTVNTRDKGDVQTFKGEIPWPKVREWGMNGHDISGLTITGPFPFLGEKSRILDTPGVDSTDAAHEAVTVEQLYTTDAIVYVMDYNHVQSETNLYFLKQCSVEQKPIFLVINQIDKHNEKEVTIKEFKQSLETVLAKWEIETEDVFFTTMKEPDHPLNDFNRLERMLKSLLYHGEELFKASKVRLEQGFSHAVYQRLEEEKQEKLDEINEEMEKQGYGLDMLAEKENVVKEIHRVSNYEDWLLDSFHSQFQRTFSNVTLFPYTTTELATEWIESLKPGFKVGILFTKKKTEEEREQRLIALVNELEDKTKTLLFYKVKTYLQELDRSALSNKERFESELSTFQIPPLREWLMESVKTDHTDRQYVRTFTSQITDKVVRYIQDEASKRLRFYASEMEQRNKEQLATLNAQQEKLDALKVFELKIDKVKEEYDRILALVKNHVSDTQEVSEYKTAFKEATRKTYPKNMEESDLLGIELPEESVIATTGDEQRKTERHSFDEEEVNIWLSKVNHVLTSNKRHSLLENERKQLMERINRFNNQTFVVSLFGAFSAGKSSFANALLGDDVLPVSPNPTTATVNTVQKSTTENPHGTAAVKVKSQETIENEIKAIAKELGTEVNYQTLSRWKPNKRSYVTSIQKTYAEYLETLRDSLQHTEWTLGTTFTLSQSELKPVVAEESYACLVDQVDLYYDCTITKSGVVLVDTPGVNSIHGRHTNVAFKQMRQSDAIFYLTYYNHAFSKADEYFLQQMGKVNESFSKDKLYFVINASDLASSEGELFGVRRHVQDQLVRNGIDSPRLFHLSSKQGLLNKKSDTHKQEDPFQAFEDTFYSETIDELKRLSAEMITLQLSKFVDKASESLAFMSREKKEQQNEHERIAKVVSEEKKRVEKADFTFVKKDTVEEFEQLTIYLRERMRYVLTDYFPASFNVTVLTGSTKRVLHEQFKGAVREWIGFAEQFLSQELEATFIRMEQRIARRVSGWLRDELGTIQQQLPYADADLNVEPEPVSISRHDIALFVQEEKYATQMKSKKEIFENGGLKEVKEQLISEGHDNASSLLRSLMPEFERVIEKTVSSMEESVKQRLIQSIDMELARFEALFDSSEQQALMEEKQQIQNLL